MNNKLPPGDPHGAPGDPGEIERLRDALSTSMERSAAAHRETMRIASAILDRTAPVDTAVPTPSRPETWPVRPAPTAPSPAPYPSSTTRSDSGSRIPAFLSDRDSVTIWVSVLGGVITVIGVVFLAVQAFSRGWLGPGTAVAGAAALCVLLILTAFAVHRRSPAGPTAPALVSVGVLGLFTDLWVLVFGLGWLSPPVGVFFVAAVATGGLLTAWLWTHQALAVVLIIAGAAFLTPAVIYLLNVMQSVGYESTSLLVLALVGAAATWHREWRTVALSSAAVFTLGVLILYSEPQPVPIAVGASAGIAVMAFLSVSGPAQNSRLAAVTRWIPVSLIPVLCLVGGGATGWSTTSTVLVCLSLAGATAAFAAIRATLTGVQLRPAPNRTDAPEAGTLRAALCCGVAGVVAVLMIQQDSVNAVESLWWMTALIAVATALVVLSGHVPVPLTWAVFLIALAYCLPRVVPAWITWSGDSPAVLWPVLVMIAVPGVLAVRKAGTLGATPEVTMALGAVLLVVSSSAIPLIFIAVSDTDPAFMAGHLVVSVMWMSLGVGALIRGSGAAGLSLAVLASAKLVFYDLSALSGLIQVAAFLICGLILLVAAVARERTKGSTTTTV